MPITGGLLTQIIHNFQPPIIQPKLVPKNAHACNNNNNNDGNNNNEVVIVRIHKTERLHMLQ